MTQSESDIVGENLYNIYKLTFEDELPADITDEEYALWFSLSTVDGVRIGPSIEKVRYLLSHGAEQQWASSPTPKSTTVSSSSYGCDTPNTAPRFSPVP